MPAGLLVEPMRSATAAGQLATASPRPAPNLAPRPAQILVPFLVSRDHLICFPPLGMWFEAAAPWRGMAWRGEPPLVYSSAVSTFVFRQLSSGIMEIRWHAISRGAARSPLVTKCSEGTRPPGERVRKGGRCHRHVTL